MGPPARGRPLVVDDVVVRAGDADRDETARILRDACAEGRLEVDELDARLAAAYAAATIDELGALTSDLPVRTESPPAAGAKLWWPGVAGFHVERPLRAGREDVYEDAMRTIVPRMALSGFRLVADVPARQLTFFGGGRVVTVLFHPARHGGTILAAFGDAPRRVRRAFATLSD